MVYFNYIFCPINAVQTRMLNFRQAQNKWIFGCSSFKTLLGMEHKIKGIKKN